MTPMMEISTRSSVELITRAVEGDQLAWYEIFEHSYPKVRRSIRRRMDGRLRQRCDSVDIANSVMKDFCAKIGQLEFTSMKAMEAFLIQAAEQKLIDEHRRQHGLKRNVRMERPADGALHVAANTPTPSRVFEAKEDYEQVLEEAKNPIEEKIVAMKAAGASTDEIATETGAHRRAIQRVLKRLRKLFNA